jgi:hypothetical protein
MSGKLNGWIFIVLSVSKMLANLSVKKHEIYF